MKQEDILERFEDYKEAAEAIATDQHSEAELDYLFYNGKSDALRIGLYAEEERAIVNFNHVKPVVDAVGGLFRQLRRKAQYNSRDEDSDRASALTDVMNTANNVLRDNCNLKYMESQQDKVLLITGLGGLDTSVSLTQDPKGSVSSEVIAYDELFVDPNARQPNLLDAEFIYREKKLSLETALALFPGSDVYDFESVSGENKIDRVKDRTEPAYNDLDELQVPRGSLVKVRKLEWKQLEGVRIYRNPAYTYFEDPVYLQRVKFMLEAVADYIQDYIDENEDYEDGFKSEFDATDEYLVVPEQFYKVVEPVLEELGQVQYEERQRYCLYTAFIGSQKVFNAYKSICQETFSIKVKTGYYDEDSGTWYAMVRSMREPALYLNKTMTEMLFIIASRAKGGVLYETDAVYDGQEFEELYSQTNSAIEVAPGSLAAGKIMPKQENATATGYENILATFYELPAKSVGLNTQFLGQADDGQVSGVLEQQRIRQVQSVLAEYIDSISLHDMDLARLMLSYIRYLVQINDDFGVSVAGENGRTEFIKLTSEIVDTDYDIALGEVPIGPAQKEAQAEMSLRIADRVAAITGDPSIYAFPAEALESYGFSQKQIKELTQAVSPEPTPEMQQQQQQQMQMQQQAAEIEMENKQADTAKKLADAERSMAQADENQQELAVKQIEAESKASELMVKQEELELKRLEMQLKERELLLKAREAEIQLVMSQQPQVEQTVDKALDGAKDADKTSDKAMQAAINGLEAAIKAIGEIKKPVTKSIKGSRDAQGRIDINSLTVEERAS